jgi:O-acetyl-ADP-ribose deacetylase (regulator of RNase III)
MPISSFIGDITTQHFDAIVNSANPLLIAGGGVCGAIHRAAGPELEAACRKIGKCEVGSAVITPAFNLPSQFVIHAVGPRWLDGTRNEPELLKNCYKSIFLIAAKNGIKSIAIPSISTGIYHYPREAAAEIAVHAANAYAPPSMDIKFVCFDAETLNNYMQAIGHLRGEF